MHLAKEISCWLLRHWPDVVVALVLGVIVDLFRIGSLLRSGVRHLKNRMAEHSVGRLRSRIALLERYRIALDSYADKALYMGTLGSIIGMLVLISFAGMLALIDNLGFGNDHGVAAICALAAAMGMGLKAWRLAAIGADIDREFSTLIAKVDMEISALRRRLEQRTR
jgi:hypothetical protein